MEEKNETKDEEIVYTNEDNYNENNNGNEPNKKVIYIILGVVAFILVCIIIFCNYYNSLTFKTTKKNNSASYTESTDNNGDKDEIENAKNNDNQSDLDKNESSNNANSTSTEVINTFDFDKMVEDINNSFVGGAKASISKCTMKTVDDPTAGNYGDEVPSSVIEDISQDSFNIVVNKLKMATSFNEITLNTFDEKRGALSNGKLSGRCNNRGISYSIGKFNGHAFDNSLQIYYSSDENDLLVHYNLVRYEFHYENASDINNFIESLK